MAKQMQAKQVRGKLLGKGDVAMASDIGISPAEWPVPDIDVEWQAVTTHYKLVQADAEVAEYSNGVALRNGGAMLRIYND